MLLVQNRCRDRLKKLSVYLVDSEWLAGAFSAGDRPMVSVLLRLRASGLRDEYANFAAYVARGKGGPPTNVLSPPSWLTTRPNRKIKSPASLPGSSVCDRGSQFRFG